MKRYCFALDLKNDPTLIESYKKHHDNIWPEIVESIQSSGIIEMQIYLIENRLFMIMDTTDDFNMSEKAAADDSNPKVQEWEKLMWTYQQSLPTAKPGEKWQLMDKIFQL